MITGTPRQKGPHRESCLAEAWPFIKGYSQSRVIYMGGNLWNTHRDVTPLLWYNLTLCLPFVKPNWQRDLERGDKRLGTSFNLKTVLRDGTNRNIYKDQHDCKYHYLHYCPILPNFFSSQVYWGIIYVHKIHRSKVYGLSFDRYKKNYYNQDIEHVSNSSSPPQFPSCLPLYSQILTLPPGPRNH